MIRFISRLLTPVFALTLLLIISCSDENPKQGTKKEKVVNFVVLEVYYNNIPFEPADIVFSDVDEDGVFESDYPLPELLLKTGSVNWFNIRFAYRQEGTKAYEEEILENMEDHIVCFEITNDVMSNPQPKDTDYDKNGLRNGLATDWTVSSTPGKIGTIKMTMRHQPEIKDGNCPGEGTVDFEIIQAIKTYQL